MRLHLRWPRRDKLRCRQAIELLTEYLEEALPARERSRLEAHLRTCDGCRAYLEQLRATIAALGRARLPPADPSVRAELIELYRRFRAKPS
ncbi:MAG TPA: zf-HC2 domain-containing protein [Acidimicrobiales bacterium]